jgi:hypothetical protein
MGTDDLLVVLYPRWVAVALAELLPTNVVALYVLERR